MKIFVGNLSLLVTEEDLNLIFKAFGEVRKIKIINDKQGSSAVATVEMKNESDAWLAINVLDGIELIDHAIILRVRNEVADRRSTTERRITDNRRILSLRRSSSDRRLTVEPIDFGNRRMNSDQRSYNERRQLAVRRTITKRRASVGRRALALA